jgi:hypothetical protein
MIAKQLPHPPNFEDRLFHDVPLSHLQRSTARADDSELRESHSLLEQQVALSVLSVGRDLVRADMEVIVVFRLFAQSILLIAHPEPETRTLSGRLAALRFWPSSRKRPV